jgi:hypothetical protein
MVDTAKWVQANVPPNALLAVHDIGAVGYFDRHSIVDLAGLVSRDVLPFMRDQEQLTLYLDERGVNYLITLPSFYPDLIEGRELVFPPDGSCLSDPQLNKMCVFLWK